jgi:NADH-quinone oxidoreductase subunit M
MGMLSAAIWTPIVLGVLILAFGKDEHAVWVRWMALLSALLSFALCLPLYTHFDNNSASMQFVENIPWILRFNMAYHLGVDGISLWFVLLTSFITFVVVISAVGSHYRTGAPVHGCFLGPQWRDDRGVLCA